MCLVTIAFSVRHTVQVSGPQLLGTSVEKAAGLYEMAFWRSPDVRTLLTRRYDLIIGARASVGCDEEYRPR